MANMYWISYKQHNRAVYIHKIDIRDLTLYGINHKHAQVGSLYMNIEETLRRALIANIWRQNCFPNDISAGSNKTPNPIRDPLKPFLPTLCIMSIILNLFKFNCFKFNCFYQFKEWRKRRSLYSQNLLFSINFVRSRSSKFYFWLLVKLLKHRSILLPWRCFGGKQSLNFITATRIILVMEWTEIVNITPFAGNFAL